MVSPALHDGAVQDGIFTRTLNPPVIQGLLRRVSILRVWLEKLQNQVLGRLG